MPKGPTAIEIIWQQVWVRALAYLLLFSGLFAILIHYRDRYAFALQVAIIGFVIAYVLNPLVEAMARVRIRRPFAVIFVYFVLLLVIFVGSVLIGDIIEETQRFINLVPQAFDRLYNIGGEVSTWFNNLVNRLPDWILERFSTADNSTVADGIDISREYMVEEVRKRLETFLAQAATGLGNVLNNLLSNSGGFLVSGFTNILSTTVQVALILLVSAYFLYDFPKFTENFKRYIPIRYKPFYEDFTAKADQAVGGYLRGQLLITVLLGLLIFIGLSIIRVPLAPAISFVAAVFNLVPYLGPIIGGIPAVLLALTVSPWAALFTVLVFVAANQIEGNVLSPLILSRSTNLHPVTVMLAILAGAGMLGLVGALLAVPVVALSKVMLEDYLLTRPSYTGIREAIDDDHEADERQA